MNIWIFVVSVGVVILVLADALAGRHNGYRGLRALFAASRRLLSFPGNGFERKASCHECYVRLRQLGFRSLKEYLRSHLWRQAKQRYRRSVFPKRCLVCNVRKVQLHHRTYERIGNEKLADLAPLCRTHHKQLHAWIDRDSRLSLKDTDEIIRFMKEQRRGARQPFPERARGPSATLKAEPRRVARSRKHRTRSRAGNAWTPAEDAELLRCYDQKMSAEEMAAILHRGCNAIEIRLFKLGKAPIGWQQ